MLSDINVLPQLQVIICHYDSLTLTSQFSWARGIGCVESTLQTN
jgi:hypothetical protein